MSEESSKLAMTKTILATVGPIAASAMVARTVFRDILPDEFQDYFVSGIRSIFSRFSNDFTMVIDEFDKIVNNEIYEAAELYLGGMVNSSTRRLKISKAQKEKSINVKMEKGEEIVDVFNGVKLRWIWIVNKAESHGRFYNPRDMNSTLRGEVRCFYLTFHKKYKDMVIDSYLPFLLDQAKLKNHEKKTLKLFTLDPEGSYDINHAWMDITLDHPAKFDTLAMDSELKDMILKDLDRFVKRRDYYRKVGKAWKRGYLLYGPPGTGKSSMIAAMANYLNFDIYDLDLTAVRRNSDLRKLLVATANKSILVVEDIDCTVELKERTTDEATADSKKKSDDVEEDESQDHPLFEEIEDLIRTMEVTPAEVAEQLLHHDEAEASLKGLVDFLYKKKKETEEIKAKKEKEAEAGVKEGNVKVVDDVVKKQEAKGKEEDQESMKVDVFIKDC